MRAVPAASLEPHRLVDLWNAAYAGYFVPMSWDLAQLDRHVAVGSIDLERSLVWLDGGAPVALSLLGVRTAGPGPADSAQSTGESDQSSVHHPAAPHPVECPGSALSDAGSRGEKWALDQ